jgi:hypothetical protein
MTSDLRQGGSRTNFPARLKIRGSSVSVVTRLGAVFLGFYSRQGEEFFYLCYRVKIGSEAHPASYPVGNGSSFAGGGGVKRPVRKADHSPPSSAEVKNTRSYTSSTAYSLMVWCLVKHRDFTFTLTFYLHHF